MKINVTDIQRDLGQRQGFSGQLGPLENIIWQGEPVSFKEPLNIEGTVTNGGEMLVINAAVRGTVILMCGSCMGSFEHVLDFSFEARLKKASTDDDPDYFAYEGYIIDLTDIVLEFLLLELPSMRRCREDCQGLCPSCGSNLNEQSCQCILTEEEDPDDDIDERLRALKDFFPTQDKEV